MLRCGLVGEKEVTRGKNTRVGNRGRISYRSFLRTVGYKLDRGLLSDKYYDISLLLHLAQDSKSLCFLRSLLPESAKTFRASRTMFKVMAAYPQTPSHCFSQPPRHIQSQQCLYSFFHTTESARCPLLNNTECQHFARCVSKPPLFSVP